MSRKGTKIPWNERKESEWRGEIEERDTTRIRGTVQCRDLQGMVGAAAMVTVGLACGEEALSTETASAAEAVISTCARLEMLALLLMNAILMDGANDLRTDETNDRRMGEANASAMQMHARVAGVTQVDMGDLGDEPSRQGRVVTAVMTGEREKGEREVGEPRGERTAETAAVIEKEAGEEEGNPAKGGARPQVLVSVGVHFRKRLLFWRVICTVFE